MLETKPLQLDRSAGRYLRRGTAFVSLILLSMALAPALMAANSRVRVYAVDKDGVPQANEISRATFWAPNTSYSIARTYAVGDQDYLLLIGGATGRARVIELDAAGNVVADPIQKLNLGAGGWRSAEIVHFDDSTFLFLFDPRDGAYRRYEITDDGLIDPDSVQDDEAFASLQGKAHLDSYVEGGEPRLFAIESATGKAVLHRLVSPHGTVVEAGYSPGWSSIDHLRTGGTQYRLLYKEVGHTYLPVADNGVEAGRLAVLELDADGLERRTLLDQGIEPGYTIVRFYEFDDDQWKILAYQPDGVVRVGPPLGTTGRAVMVTLRAGFDELLTYRRSGSTFVVGVELNINVDPGDKLTGERAARLAQCVHDNLRGRTVGYQLAVNQLGREVLNRSWGYHQLVPSTVPLERDSRLNMGSVGKMMTTITALQLADDGDIDLNESVGSQVDPVKYPPGALDPWIDLRTPLDLMAQTTGHVRGDGPDCVEEGDDLTVQCIGFANHEPLLGDLCDPGQSADLPFFACPYSYVNAHFGMLRQVIEGQTGKTTTPEIDQLTRNRWLDDVFLEGPSCRADSTEKYFGLCKAGDSCFEYDNQSWIQGDPDRVDGWSRSCGAGGWQGSAQDMARILEAVRARKVLSSKKTNLLLDKNHVDVLGGSVGIGWEAPYRAGNSNQRVLGKNGAAGRPGTRSFLTYLAGDTQAALFLNSSGAGISPELLLPRAYGHALWPDSGLCTPILSFRSRSEAIAGVGTEVDIVDIDTDSYVSAHLDLGGSLILKSWYNEQSAQNELQYQDIHDVGLTGIFRLMRLSPSQFVVARTDANGDLRVGLYLVSFGNILLLDEDFGGEVEDIAVVPLGRPEADFATVLKNSDSELEIIVWDRTGPAADELDRIGEWTGAETIREVAAVDAREDGRFVVAIRNDGHKLEPTVFDVDAAGVVELKGSATEADQMKAKDVRITRITNEEGDLYVTAVRGLSGNGLKLATWQVAANGDVTRLLTLNLGPIGRLGTDLRSGKSLGPYVDPYVLVPYIDGAGNAVLQALSLPNNQSILIDGTATVGDASAIATLSRAFGADRHFATSAVVQDSGVVEIVNWEALNGDF